MVEFTLNAEWRTEHLIIILFQCPSSRLWSSRHACLLFLVRQHQGWTIRHYQPFTEKNSVFTKKYKVVKKQTSDIFGSYSLPQSWLHLFKKLTRIRYVWLVAVTASR